MANYCGKCGSKLDEATGLCPNCDAAKMKQHYDKTTEDKTPVRKEDKIDKQTKKKALKARKKALKREKRANWSTGKKVRRFFLKLILTVIFLAVFAAGVTGALVYFDVVEIPSISYILERSGLEKKESVSINPLVDNYVPEENTIAYDEETNLFYANNEIIVIFSNDATDIQKEEVISYLDGELVGTIPELNMYQIMIPDCDTLQELLDIAEEVTSKFDYVIYATYDTATVNQSDVYAPNDPWDGDVTKQDWEDGSVDGSNWWMEAIDVQNAWDYQDHFSEIAIGICDSSFDTGHEDLKNKVLFPNEILESRNVVAPWWYDHNNFKDEKSMSVKKQENYHGTHVAGIIGAEGDNKKGITGIVQNCKLLLAPYYRSNSMDAYLAWDSSTYANLSYLVKAGAKVINFSQGKTNFLSESTNHVAYSEEIIEREGNLASISIAQLINSGYKDFIIVQSAGNGTGDTGKALDAIQNGWFASITDDSITGYDDITIGEVRSHVIIVGAAEQTSSGFQCASFSNYGTQVNICAPGVKIYSTVPGEVFYDFQFAGGYGYESGTSMSAPIVTGVCALTWSANPELLAEEVKNIVCNSSNVKVSASPEDPDNLSYNMVNAAKAVEAALNYIPENSEDDQSQYNIPSDAVELNGHYYYVYDVDTVIDWNMAQEYCEAQGGYLATITSPEEDAFLYSYITDAGYSSVMFGLTDQEQTDDWHWVTGEELSYQNWRSGEPNHQGGYEHYGMYYEKNPDGTWNDGSGRGGPFLCEWGEYSVATTPPSENHYETDSAFGKYLAAAAKTTETGSWSEQLTLEADMSIAYEGGRTKTKVTLTADSDVSNYVEDDLSQIEITSLANMKVMGQTYAWSTEYYDGVAHYEYTEPFQRSESLEIPPDFFDFEASIPEEAILTEEVSGNQIRFIVSGEEMTETGIAAVQQMSGVNNLECEDVEVIATLNDSGSINQIIMNFDASVKYQGYDADVTYKIQYTFN